MKSGETMGLSTNGVSAGLPVEKTAPFTSGMLTIRKARFVWAMGV